MKTKTNVRAGGAAAVIEETRPTKGVRHENQEQRESWCPSERPKTIANWLAHHRGA